MPVVAQITITMDEKGQINVNGPLEQKMLMFGLLEIAKETTSNYNNKAKSGIVVPPPGFTLPPTDKI